LIVSTVRIAVPAAFCSCSAAVLSVTGFQVGPMMPFVNACAWLVAPVTLPSAANPEPVSAVATNAPLALSHVNA